MNNKLILSLSIAALLTVACSQSDDDAAKKSTAESLSDKASSAVSSMKETTKEAADVAIEKGQEIKEVVVDEAKSAAEEASSFVKKGSSKVVEVAEDAKEGLSNSVDAVKEKAASLMSDASSADLEAGKSIYSTKCVACHGAGVAGAPKLDDESWSTRKAQGTDIMVEHALKGFQGTKGYMPAKGGFAALSDAEVSAAVAYMISVAK